MKQHRERLYSSAAACLVIYGAPVCIYTYVSMYTDSSSNSQTELVSSSFFPKKLVAL